jgi:hypothetical protein
MAVPKIEIAPERVAEAAAPPSPPDRAAIAARIQGMVERQMNAVERVLNALGPANQIEAERTARALRDIAAINRSDEVTPPDAADDAPVPRDIDEFRRALARRIRIFVEARRNGDGRLSADAEGTLE